MRAYIISYAPFNVTVISGLRFRPFLQPLGNVAPHTGRKGQFASELLSSLQSKLQRAIRKRIAKQFAEQTAE
ncbi:MAG: hypothetical protein O7G86_14835, partial [Gammaproteobacteria bacterium]|nr:hypothetical protein [Gammaproteobacteria bacterium]